MPEEKEKFLRKKEREICWGARDQFWKCMTNNNEDMDKCKETRQGFIDVCPSTWVTHFDRKFQYEKFKKKLDKEGFQAADEQFEKDSKK